MADKTETRVWILEVTATGAKEPHHTSRCIGDKALDEAMRAV